MAANAVIPDQTNWFIGGSQPSLFQEISNCSTENYLVMEGSLVPSHGKGSAITSFNANVDRTYKSNKTGNVYVVAGTTGYYVDSSLKSDSIFSIPKTLGTIDISENLNGELGISTGSAFYDFDYLTGDIVEVTEAMGLTITTPIACACVDTIMFVGDGLTSTIQASKPNNAKDFTNNQTFKFESKADNLVSIGVIDRTLFFIGETIVERWVVSGGDALLSRDNVFLYEYGLQSKLSFANDVGRFVGLFTTKKGGLQVACMMAGSEQFVNLTQNNAGLIKKIANSGRVINATIYEIDNYVYYELTTQTRSFIYNFTTQTWTESTSPFTQVQYIGTTYCGTYLNTLYPITLYENDQFKRRLTQPTFPNEKLKRGTVGQIKLWYNNINLEKGIVKIGGTRDQIDFIAEDNEIIDGQNIFACVSRCFGMDYFQFSMLIETYLNIKWRAIDSEVVLNG